MQIWVSKAYTWDKKTNWEISVETFTGTFVITFIFNVENIWSLIINFELYFIDFFFYEDPIQNY